MLCCSTSHPTTTATLRLPQTRVGSGFVCLWVSFVASSELVWLTTRSPLWAVCLWAFSVWVCLSVRSWATAGHYRGRAFALRLLRRPASPPFQSLSHDAPDGNANVCATVAQRAVTAWAHDDQLLLSRARYTISLPVRGARSGLARFPRITLATRRAASVVLRVGSRHSRA